MFAYILGIAVIGGSDISTDLVGSNQISDYSYLTQPFSRDRFNVILRCASGLGQSGEDSSTSLGGWYLNGNEVQKPTGTPVCGFHPLEVRGANSRKYPGVINLYLCGILNATEEGVYECRMMDSSMVEQTMRVGVYFRGRSESFDMCLITSLLIIFYLSTQLLQ